MKKLIILSLVIISSGCASLSKQAFRDIHEGDSKDKVIEEFGDPDTFGTSQRIADAQAWYYSSRGETCAFTIKDNIVRLINCGRDTNYVSGTQSFGRALSAFSQGMSQSMNQNENKKVHCVSTSNIYQTTTDCQ